MKKILKLILNTFALLFVFFFFSCSIGKLNSNTGHNYDSKYNYNEYYHYHYCLDEGCSKVDSLEPHKYGEEMIRKEPTCTEDGELFKVCLECGYEFVYPSPAHHTMEVVPYKSPTCEEDGNRKYYRCINCDFISNSEKGTVPCTLEEVTYPKKGHDNNSALLKITNQTDDVDGKVVIDFQCCVKDIEISIPCFNKEEYYDITTVDSTCEKEGLKTYTINAKKMRDIVFEATGEIDFQNSVLASIISKEETIEKKPHNYQFSLDFPTYEEYGSVYFYCTECKEFKTNKNGSNLVYHFGKYDKNKDFITEIKNESTCATEGEIEYILSKDFIVNRLLGMYDMTREELSPYVDNISYQYSFVSLDPVHHYEERISTYTYSKAYISYYLECKYHSNVYLYHNNYKSHLSQFPLSGDFVEDSVTELFCEKEGSTTYYLVRDKVLERIKTELELTDDEVEEYVNFLDQDNRFIEVHEPLEHLYGDNSISITFPTDTTYGIFQIRCIRENCGEYLETLSEDDKITLPKVSSDMDGYDITETYIHCTNIGHVNYSIKMSYLVGLAEQEYGSVFDSSIFNKDTTWTLDSSYVLYPIGHEMSLTQSAGTYSETVKFKCSYCLGVMAEIPKPPYSEETYETSTVKGNCVTKTLYIYLLKIEKALEILKEYPIFYEQKYPIERYANSFRSGTEILEYGSYVPNIHGGSMSFYTDDQHPFSKPTYDVATGIATNGKYYYQCECKNYIVADDIPYTEGYWVYDSSNKAYRYFTGGKYNVVIGDARTSFTIVIANEEGTCLRSYTYGKDDNSAFKYIFNKGDFKKSGKSVDSISVYIDGVYYPDNTLISNGRMSYINSGGRHTGYSISVWKDSQKNLLPGDVRVILHYKE